MRLYWISSTAAYSTSDSWQDGSNTAPPEQIVLDLDATDIPLDGHQPERFFHGYYDSNASDIVNSGAFDKLV
jgi:hypothetical protein